MGTSTYDVVHLGERGGFSVTTIVDVRDGGSLSVSDIFFQMPVITTNESVENHSKDLLNDHEVECAL